MAHFLRDQQVTNLTINEDAINQINTAFTSRMNTYNMIYPRNDNSGQIALMSYTIRFDGKGYRVYTLEDLLLYFRQAKKVERIIFTLENGISLNSGRKTGTVMELILDQKNNNGCFLVVTSDDKDWVDASFSTAQDVLAKFKNKNKWVRTAWLELLIKISGVTLGFLLSLWGAAKISPKIAIENSFTFSFLFLLLIYSNAWLYLNNLLVSFICDYFPNIKFNRADKDSINWVPQGIIIAIIGGLTIWILGALFSYFGIFINSFIVKSA